MGLEIKKKVGKDLNLHHIFVSTSCEDLDLHHIFVSPRCEDLDLHHIFVSTRCKDLDLHHIFVSTCCKDSDPHHIFVSIRYVPIHANCCQRERRHIVMLHVFPFPHSFSSKLMIGLVLYWSVHTSSNLSTLFSWLSSRRLILLWWDCCGLCQT